MRAPRSGSNPPPQRDGALLHLALHSIGHVADDVADEVTAIGRGHRISVGVARLDGVDRPDKSAHGRVVLSQSPVARRDSIRCEDRAPGARRRSR